MRDLLDAPGRRAEQERFADPRLEHHLFVELAHAPLPRLGADEEHAVQAAIGDGPSARERDPCGALAGADRPGDAVPHDARPQLREFIGRITAREHVEDVVELGAAGAPRTAPRP